MLVANDLIRCSSQYSSSSMDVFEISLLYYSSPYTMWIKLTPSNDDNSSFMTTTLLLCYLTSTLLSSFTIPFYWTCSGYQDYARCQASKTTQTCSYLSGLQRFARISRQRPCSILRWSCRGLLKLLAGIARTGKSESMWCIMHFVFNHKMGKT
jgi:hypothetical protein